jgi:hypothetical protein
VVTHLVLAIGHPVRLLMLTITLLTFVDTKGKFVDTTGNPIDQQHETRQSSVFTRPMVDASKCLAVWTQLNRANHVIFRPDLYMAI